MELETRRLRLRPYRRDDIDRLAALYGDADVAAFTKLGRLTRAQAEATLEEYLATWRGKDFGVHAASLKSSGEFAGECGLFVLESRDDPALRYAFHTRFWGRGLASEAARAVLDDAFGRLGLTRVLCFVEGTNDASHRIAKKLGFDLERVVQISKGELYAYAMTAEQWVGRGYSSRAQDGPVARGGNGSDETGGE